MVRSAYLGLLWVLGLTAWQATVGWSQTATLGDTARFGMLLFQLLTMYVQLPLLVFFALRQDECSDLPVAHVGFAQIG